MFELMSVLSEKEREFHQEKREDEMEMHL